VIEKLLVSVKICSLWNKCLYQKSEEWKSKAMGFSSYLAKNQVCTVIFDKLVANF